MENINLYQGDCLERMRKMDANSVDSIVTDPPYGLSFMCKKWDYDVPSHEIWEECMRVLKPGGHLLAFAGSRTYHRMAVRIEDAGFEIRDQIMWLYGSGFPKSHNVGKAVDKLQGNGREVIGTKIHSQKGVKAAEERTTIGAGAFGEPREAVITKGTSPYEGWGTALKPAHEPIAVARKPLSEKTIASNVLKWGTGAINIDDSRIGTSENLNGVAYSGGQRCEGDWKDKSGFKNDNLSSYSQPTGRFPANIILDEEAGRALDEQSDVASRFFYCAKTSKRERNEGCDGFEVSRPDDRSVKGMGSFNEKGVQPSRNNHPTVKPVDLMLYLVRLVTPRGGITLDPFMGSGSTGKAAIRGGFKFIGIELDESYFDIAKARVEYERDNPFSEKKVAKAKPKKDEVKLNQQKLF